MKYKCCICGKVFDDWGNDPWPVNMNENARCCNECDMKVVVPRRIEDMFRRKRQ